MPTEYGAAAREMLGDIVRVLHAVGGDFARGFVSLRPKSWRREGAYWLAAYAAVAVAFHLPL